MSKPLKISYTVPKIKTLAPILRLRIFGESGDGFIQAPIQSAAPDEAEANTIRLYFKADGLYGKNEEGTEFLIGPYDEDIDGGTPTSIYGGTDEIDGGTP